MEMPFPPGFDNISDSPGCVSPALTPESVTRSRARRRRAEAHKQNGAMVESLMASHLTPLKSAIDSFNSKVDLLLNSMPQSSAAELQNAPSPSLAWCTFAPIRAAKFGNTEFKCDVSEHVDDSKLSGAASSYYNILPRSCGVQPEEELSPMLPSQMLPRVVDRFEEHADRNVPKVIQFDSSDVVHVGSQTDDCAAQLAAMSLPHRRDAASQCPEVEYHVVLFDKFHTEDASTASIDDIVAKGAWEPLAHDNIFEVDCVIEVVGNILTLDSDDVMGIRLPRGLLGKVCRVDDEDGGDAHVFFPELKSKAYPWRWVAGEDIAKFRKCVAAAEEDRIEDNDAHIEAQDVSSDLENVMEDSVCGMPLPKQSKKTKAAHTES
ncbi:unnamed protein product [Polarella glacialis]|uniref:Uncharacterized protein n=1 Tax=Polarella glacialis TaxID=89957 RepID=A0A813E8M8_POLGL|nr:unnamed protein product [Polarella glacialis]